MHCHVEAGPTRTEELEIEALEDILKIIKKFSQIQTVDLTGGAPEMNAWFKEILELSVSLWKKVIVRTNLTIFFVKWYKWIPEYLAENKVEIVASLPCYLEDNVDKMRGDWVYEESMKALQILNKLWYWNPLLTSPQGRGKAQQLILNLVYNTPMSDKIEDFSLAPDQKNLEKDYKDFLLEKFGIVFNNLFAFTNIPSGRLKNFFKTKDIYEDYINFLALAYNPSTLNNLMCKTQLSIDYMWNIFDCDFNQVEWVPALWKQGKKLKLKDILEEQNLELIKTIMVRDYCFGCTAWAGCSCGGALV